MALNIHVLVCKQAVAVFAVTDQALAVVNTQVSDFRHQYVVILTGVEGVDEAYGKIEKLRVVLARDRHHLLDRVVAILRVLVQLDRVERGSALNCSIVRYRHSSRWC